MRKLLVLALVCVFLASSVLGALNFELDKPQVTMGKGETAIVILTAKDNGVAKPSISLSVEQVCREESGSAYSYMCDSGDTMDPGELSVGVATPTDVSGKATITIKHNGSDKIGEYHYTICDVTLGECDFFSASVTGNVAIPEFTAIGTGLAFVGACSIYLKGRNMRRSK